MSDQHQPQGPSEPVDSSAPPLAPPEARPAGYDAAPASPYGSAPAHPAPAAPYQAPAAPYTAAPAAPYTAAPTAPYPSATERPAYQPPASPYGATPAVGTDAPTYASSPYAQAPYAAPADGPTTTLPAPGYGAPGYGAPGYGPGQPYGAPYGQSPYGPPNPAAYGGYAPPPTLRTNGVAIAALVVGGLGLLLSAVPFLGATLGLVGVVLGILGIRRARGDMGGKGLAIGGLAAGGVGLLIGAAVTSVLLFAVRSTQSTIDEAMEEAEQRQQEIEDGTSDGSSGIASDEQAELDAATRLGLGESAVVGDYTVTVTAIDTDADDVVAAADQYNSEPVHRYVLVDLTVTYAGETEGDPFWDLETAVLGSDGREYTASTCWATLPQDPMELDPVAPGATASYQVCMDVPAEASAGSALRVEELFSFDGSTPAFWTVP